MSNLRLKITTLMNSKKKKKTIRYKKKKKKQIYDLSKTKK